MLYYYHHILHFYTEQGRGNKFRLAPLAQIKSHFLSIDNTVLREILINVRKKAHEKDNIVFPEWMSRKIDEKDIDIHVWKATFNYDGLRRRRTFSQHVDTDGTKLNFHFQVTKKKLKKKGKNRKNKIKKKKNSPRRVISIDPGRTNLITAYDTVKDRYHVLTGKYYYRATGMTEKNKRTQHRNLTLKGVYDAMSRTPTKTIDEMNWYSYQQLIARYYNDLWELNATEKLRRENFKIKRLKEKCLDRFFNRFMEKGDDEPMIVYGAASINPSGKGELGVPVKYVYEKCRQKYQTIKEDERYTTQMHHTCQEQTWKVKRGSRDIRGLRWCSTCSELVSRDKNACKNIAFSYGKATRPMYLCDTYERGRKNIFLLKATSRTHPIISRCEGDGTDRSVIRWINGKFIFRN